MRYLPSKFQCSQSKFQKNITNVKTSFPNTLEITEVPIGTNGLVGLHTYTELYRWGVKVRSADMIRVSQARIKNFQTLIHKPETLNTDWIDLQENKRHLKTKLWFSAAAHIKLPVWRVQNKENQWDKPSKRELWAPHFNQHWTQHSNSVSSMGCWALLSSWHHGLQSSVTDVIIFMIR